MTLAACFGTHFLDYTFSTEKTADSFKVSHKRLPARRFIPEVGETYRQLAKDLAQTCASKKTKVDQILLTGRGGAEVFRRRRGVKYQELTFLLTKLKLPLVWLGEEDSWVERQWLKIDLNPAETFRYFSFAEDFRGYEASLLNRAVYGPHDLADRWGQAVEESLVWYRLRQALASQPGQLLLKSSSQLYLGGSGLRGLAPEKIILAVLGAIPLSGSWQLKVDRLNQLPLRLLLGQEAATDWSSLAHLVVAPGAVKARITPSPGKSALAEEPGREAKRQVNFENEPLMAVPLGKEVTSAVKITCQGKTFRGDFGGSEFGLVFDLRSRPLPPSSRTAQLKEEKELLPKLCPVQF